MRRWGCKPGPIILVYCWVADRAVDYLHWLDGDQPFALMVGFRGLMARSVGWQLVGYSNGTEALFDLRNDPGEQRKVLSARPDIRAHPDAALTGVLLEGLRAAHADQRVPAAQSRPDHAFCRGGWSRPYRAAKQL